MNKLENLLGRFAKLFCACVLLTTSSGCVENLYQGEEGTTPEVTPNGDFSFSPVTKCTLDINYDLTGDSIPFMIYLENPILDDNNTLDESLLPYFAGFTDTDGLFNDTFELTAGVSHVYLASTMLGVPNCMELEVVNNQIKFDMSQPMTKATLKAEKEHKYPAGYKILGTWSDQGVPDYLIGRAIFPEDLLPSINATLPSSKNIFETDLAAYVKTVQSVKIKEKATVKMAFITESATIANVLGYYCYPTAQAPADKSQLTKIVAFPCANFANKQVKDSGKILYYWGALSSGNQIQLKYWNGSEFENEFPAGTTIEFFLATQSFANDPNKPNMGDLDITSQEWKPVLYSDPALNPRKTAQSIALYDKNNKLVALGFEDREDYIKTDGKPNSDRDFNDAVFTLSTQPSAALDGEGMPNLKPGDSSNQITYGNSGTLAFEDLWPNQGDYDMNDVVVHYSSVVTKTNNGVSRLKDEYSVLWSGGTIVSGFGYQLGVATDAVSSCTITSDGQTTTILPEEGQDLATILVSDNIRTQVGKTFTVETTFSTPQPSNELAPPYNPFIYAGQREKEVHLTNMKPTNKADLSLLGTRADVSNKEAGKYYVSKDNFPFAIYIQDKNGFTFKVPKEKVRIDEAYPEFAVWAGSKGSLSKNWYESPNNDKVESTNK